MLEGLHEVTDGDWIITGVKGEKYPCKPDVFEMTYEPVGGGFHDVAECYKDEEPVRLYCLYCNGKLECEGV